MEEMTIPYVPDEGSGVIFVYGENGIKEVALKGNMTFGRKTQSTSPDIAVTDKTISRNHGMFLIREGHYYYMDLESTNGSVLNGYVLNSNEPKQLSDGDVIVVTPKNSTNGLGRVVLIYSTSLTKTVWSEIPLKDASAISIGRNESMGLSRQEVSRRHASFYMAQDGWAIIDEASSNGVFLNGVRLTNPVYLNLNDVIRIASYNFIFTGKSLVYQCDEADVIDAPAGASCDVNVPTANNNAAASNSIPASAADNNVASTNNASANASSTNNANNTGRAVKSYSGTSRATLSIEIVERSVVKRLQKKLLLKDINLDIPAGNMVLILGGSGAGKTTFMNAVMGYEKADGRVSYDGIDIYEEFERMQYEIGYGPQEDLMRLSDNVYDTVRNAAELKLKSGLGDEYYDKRAKEALELLGLGDNMDQTVGSLSGGQRKRLSIAMEYVGNPSLFFLDEPDSGLDNTNATLLFDNLRRIADEGKIVIFISHSPNRVFDKLDKLIVLAKDTANECGRLVFYGAPANALKFFDVDSLEKVVARINKKSEGGDGQADYYIEKFEREGHLYE